MVRVTLAGGVSTLWFDRERVFNAIDEVSFAELGGHLRALADDDGAAVIVLRGAGEHFSSGADIKEAIPLPETLLARPIETHPTFLLYTMAKPTIAAIRGYCLGGGLEIALAADMRIAAESAVFAFPEARWGLTTGWGGGTLLKQIAGRAAALDLLLTGRRFDANEAFTLGMIQRLVPDDEFESTLDELAASLRGASPEAVRAAKRIVADSDFAADLRAEIALFAQLSQSGEAKRRLESFGGKAN